MPSKKRLVDESEENTEIEYSSEEDEEEILVNDLLDQWSDQENEEEEVEQQEDDKEVSAREREGFSILWQDDDKFPSKSWSSSIPLHGTYQNIPEGIISIVDVWKLIFSPTYLQHLLQQTNERLSKKQIKLHPTKSSSVFQLKMEDLLNYFAVWNANGIVKYHSYQHVFAEDSDGLIGNKFIKSMLPRYKFHLINRALQASLTFVMDHFNSVMKKYYFPTVQISIDDNLDRSKSFGEKLHNPKKACQDGIASQRITDKNHFT